MHNLRRIDLNQNGIGAASMQSSPHEPIPNIVEVVSEHNLFKFTIQLPIVVCIRHWSDQRCHRLSQN